MTFFFPDLNRSLSLLVDTGSSVSLLPSDACPSNFGKFRPYRGRILSVCGEELRVLGELSETFCHGGMTFVHDFLICQGLSVPILGVDFLRRQFAVVDVSKSVVSFPSGVVQFDVFSAFMTAGGSTDGTHNSDPVQSVLHDFREIIRNDDCVVGETSLVEHDIILSDYTPIHVKSRPVPIHLRETVTEQISKMLRLGIIERSTSPWSSPILLVPKSNGTYRFCVDFRRLNAKTKKDATPMPHFDEIFSQISGATVFSTMDLLSGFWQVPLARGAREFTAFTVGNQHFHFTKMPFGLTGAPGSFVRLMQTVLNGISNVVVYGDDILIFSNSISEHSEHLRSVLSRLREAGLVVNAGKCQFGLKEVKFLGHRVSAGETAPLPEKTACVRDFPRPETKKQLQSFIGLAGFYRRFVPNFSTTLVPLYDLLRKDTVWKWSKEEEAAFVEIKRKLCSHPVVLKLPNTEETFDVTTDASDTGLGAVLSQGGRVIEYASRRLNKSEKNYSASDRELLAIVWSLEKWRHYLFGRAFVVCTDHQPLTYLQSVKNPKGRMARWISRLQEYNFQVRYKPGSDNKVADSLSRLPESFVPVFTEIPSHEALPEAMEQVCALMFFGNLAELALEQQRDNTLGQVMRAIRRGERLSSNESACVRFRQIWDQMFLSEEGCLFRKFSLRGLSVAVPVIPVSLRLQFLSECHGSAHMGVQKTYDLLRVNAYWPGMESDVEKFVTTCERCQLHKPSTNLNKAPLKPILTSAPMEVWAMDIVGPLPLTASGNRYILVATDLFSKWTEAVPLPCQTAVSVARAFIGSVVLRHGTPKSLLTDQGSNFESLLIREMCRLLGVNKIRTSPFHPRTDGQTERANRTIKEWISSAGGDWEKQLPFIVHAFNCSQSAATKMSPFQLVYGRHPPLVGLHQSLVLPRPSCDYANELLRNIQLSVQRAKKNNEEAKAKFAKRYNEKNRADRWKPFNPGDKVKYVEHYPDIRNRKFSRRYRGPFVVECRRGVNYKISGNSQRSRWVHHDEIRPWLERSGLREFGAPPASTQTSDTVRLDLKDGFQDETSSSSNESESDSETRMEETVPSSPRFPTRGSRRPPGWLRDYYTE